MDSNIISKYRMFGKVGKIVMTIFAVIAAFITVSCFAATVFVARLPKEALTVSAAEQATLRFDEDSFDVLWNILGGSFTYSGDGSPEHIIEDAGRIEPPENQRFETELKLFNRSYDLAVIHSEGSTKVMEAEASPVEYNVKNLVTVFVFTTLFAASVTAAFWMLRRLFTALTKSESPFCDDVVVKMRGFGFSLLPVGVFASFSETLMQSFLSVGKSTGVSIQWGVLIAFVVTMALVSVFRYGVQLQKESDETL